MIRTIQNTAQIKIAMGSIWNQQSRLLVAIQNNDLETAKALLVTGLDADSRFYIGAEKRPAICLCVERGHVTMAELLLQHGCSINQFDQSGLTPLHIATSYGHLCLVELLLRNRANVRVVSNQGHTPLHLAAQHTASQEIVRLLVEFGSELNKRDHEDRTPLAMACSRGSYEIVAYLLSKGAEVNTVDNAGNTPLLQAVSEPDTKVELIDILLQAGAMVNVFNKHGESPLLAIIRSAKRLSSTSLNPLQILCSLVSHGANLEVVTPLGQSPLHLAIVQHHDPMVELLARVGCDPNTKDILGLTPLFHLAKDGKSKLVELLVASGVNLSKEHWIRDAKWIAEVPDLELRNWILYQADFVPSLKTSCRLSLRKFLGVKADQAIAKMNLPLSLFDYLSLSVI